MTDIATRVAGLDVDGLTALHARLDTGNPDNPADVQAHHVVTHEMLKRGLGHGHSDDSWGAAVVLMDSVTVDSPADIEAPEGLEKAWGETLANGGTVSVLLTVDGYVLKADPGVSDVHVDAVMGSGRKRRRPKIMVDQQPTEQYAKGYEPEDMLDPKQEALYEAYEGIAEQFGEFTPGEAHYMAAADNPFNGHGMNCANCVFYEGGGGCDILTDRVEAGGLCKLWVISDNLISKAAEILDSEEEFLASLTEENKHWYEQVATALDTGGDPDLLVAKSGNPEALRDYWRGGGKGKVSWGAGGDFTSCVAAVGKYMSSEQAKGYCALRHREVTGMWPGDKRNRMHKDADQFEPVLKHPGHGDQKVHGGHGGGASTDLPPEGRKMLRSNLSRGNLVESYGSAYENGKAARAFGADHVTRAVRDHAEKRDVLISRHAGQPRSMVTENASFAAAGHQGFIDGALGRRAQFGRSHSIGETVAGFVTGGLSGALKSAGEPMLKHPGHADQKVHAGRSTSVTPDVANSIMERVRANGGLSVNMLDGSEPPGGYMVARGATRGVKPAIVDAEEFYDPVRGPAALSSFMKNNRATLTRGDYLGLWHDSESGKVFLDVSENVQDKSRAERLGRRRDQISIWDVTGMKEIPTGGTGEISKSETHSGGTDAGSVDDDGRGDRRLRAGNLDEVHGEVAKHGNHDQSTHGRKGSGYRAVSERRSAAIAAGQTKRPLPRDSDGRVINPEATGGYKAGIPEAVVFGGDVVTPEHSIWHHLESDGSGGYRVTEARAKVHRQIVEDATRGVPRSDDPTFHMLGGGPAAGKTTAVKSGLAAVPGRDKAVQINADDAKGALPEFERMRMSNDDNDFFNAAAFAHEESSMIAKQIQKAAIANGQDVVLDGTGDSKYSSLKKKVGEARDSGYKVKAVYATVPTQMAVDRSNARSLDSKERRFVPESVVRGTHRDVSAVFPEAVRRGLFDEARLIDTSQRGNEVLVGETVNGRWAIRDKGRYSEFRAKGSEAI